LLVPLRRMGGGMGRFLLSHARIMDRLAVAPSP
jgi:hypothetical protein